MKSNVSRLPFFIAAGLAGVALLTLTGFLSASASFAGIASLGLLGLVFHDYTRPTRQLELPARVLRPARPAVAVASPPDAVSRAA